LFAIRIELVFKAGVHERLVMLSSYVDNEINHIFRMPRELLHVH